MRRRDVLTTLGGAVAWPLAARTQERIPRVGYLSPDPAEADAAHFNAFREGLRDLGYVDGKTIEIVARFPERGDQMLAPLANQLIDLKVDVIVTGGPGVYTAASATKTIPIVSGVGGDLVSSGLAESLGHPGGNVTGLTFFAPQLVVKRVELLKRVKPSVSRVGVFFLRGAPTIPQYVRALEGVIPSMGVTLQPIEVSNVGECAGALAAGRAAAIDGLVLTDFPLFAVGAGPATVAALAASRGLVSAGHLSFARNGGLIAYGVELPLMFRSAARFVDKIIKGARPGDLPIEQATKFTTIFNLRTAAALGLEIAPTLLAEADEVIE